MKRNLYIIMVFCAAALVSCKKAETDTPHPGTDPEPQPEGKAVLYGSLGETTKTYLHTDDNEKTFKVLWEKYDAIAIIMGGAKTAEYATQGQGVEMARFEFNEGTALNVGETFETIYPAGLVKSGVGDALSLVWPAEQEYKVIGGSNPGEAGNNPMWASATVKEPVTEMQFYNLGGVIRFKISQPSKEFSVALATLTADQPLSGSCSLEDATITVGEEQKTIKKAKITPETKSGSIIIKPSSPVSIATNGEASFCFAVPEGTYSGVKFTFVCGNGERFTAQLNPGKTLTVSRSAVTRLKASGITPTDITVDGSNCFIGEENVPIVITAMGNAFEKDKALDGNEAKAVWKAIKGNAQGCKVVWETVNTATKPADGTIIKSVSFDAENGVLTVIPTGTPGNALVAITDDVNGTGNIVWSYHIWVPETEIRKVVINNTDGNFVFLDRNIGALKAADPNVTDNTKSIGMLYQWGRKDPFLSFSDFNDTFMNNLTTANYPHSKNNNNADSKLRESIEHPDVLITNEKLDPAVYAQQTWLNNTDYINLWGWPGDKDWAPQGLTYYGKTIYDPCPLGYSVASTRDYYFIDGKVRTGYSAYISGSVWKFTSTNPLCFPFTKGISFSGSLTITMSLDYKAQIWTSVTRGNTRSTAWSISKNATAPLQTWNIGQLGSSSDGWYYVAAAQVRCIRNTQATDGEGYTLNEMDHEYINFFE